MQVVPAQVSHLLAEMKLNYFYSNGAGPRWVIPPYGKGRPTVQIALHDNGEWLYLGSDGLLDLEAVPAGERPFVLKRLMEANDKIKLGHYAGVKTVRAEVCLGLKDAPFGETQLRQHLGALRPLTEFFLKDFADERSRTAENRPAPIRDLLISLGLGDSSDGDEGNDVAAENN